MYTSWLSDTAAPTTAYAGASGPLTTRLSRSSRLSALPPELEILSFEHAASAAQPRTIAVPYSPAVTAVVCRICRLRSRTEDSSP
jgi:hypothetical protein